MHLSTSRLKTFFDSEFLGVCSGVTDVSLFVGYDATSYPRRKETQRFLVPC
jgi:hypothetical protein